jgi:hypothetical protein
MVAGENLESYSDLPGQRLLPSHVPCLRNGSNGVSWYSATQPMGCRSYFARCQREQTGRRRIATSPETKIEKIPND